MWAVLAGSTGLLVALAVIIVLLNGFRAGGKNTFTLLNRISVMLVDTIEINVRHHLDPASEQLKFLKQRFELGDVDNNNPRQIHDVLIGALAAAPQIDAVFYVDAELTEYVAGRDRRSDQVVQRRHNLSNDSMFQDMATRARFSNSKEPTWTDIYFADKRGPKGTYLQLIQPLNRTLNKTYIGFLRASVSVRELSLMTTNIGIPFNATAFILYGNDQVLAHPRLSTPHPELSPDNPTIALHRIGDDVLASLPGRERFIDNFEQAAQVGVEVSGVTVEDEEYVVFLKRISDYGAVPWTIGAYVPEDRVNTELKRLVGSAFISVLALIAAVIAAIILGRKIARPVNELATATKQIADLKLDNVKQLPTSRIRELNEQSQSFNTMLSGLRWFETYVPKTLVKQLMQHNPSPQDRHQHYYQATDIASQERELTIMFTDIIGFTTLSETMPAIDTANLLNHHFQTMSDCVETEGGTIDKFIGDSLMAFWGAPEQQDDHAARACRAALAIADIVKEDNAKRRSTGEPAIRIRIGLHTGHVIVGNIGAPSRMNYTVVGDPVNTTQRIEGLAKQFISTTEDVKILISKTTINCLSPQQDTFSLQSLGVHTLRGRNEPVEIFELG